MSASHSSARIEYKDNRGVVELRPATSEEAAAETKPESELYAPGTTVIVRPEVFDPKTRKYRILPEYVGTVVNWAGGHYNVRADQADEHGHGVRQCRTRELRPDLRVTGTAPWCANDPSVAAVVSMLKAAGHTLASLSLRKGGANTDGAFVTPEGEGNTGVRVSYLADGWSEESTKAHSNAKHRAERNDALNSYAVTFFAAGWKMAYVDSGSDLNHRALYVLVWPPSTVEQKAAALLGNGDKWIRHHFAPGKSEYLSVSRAEALRLIAEHLRSGSKVYPSTEGGVKIEPTTGKSSYWLQPFPATV